MVAGFRRPRGRGRVAEWVEVRLEQRPHVDGVGPPAPVEVRVQPVERDLGDRRLRPPSERRGDPVAVELGDHVAAPHCCHPLDRLNVLGREGWSFDDPEPVGGSRYREGDDPALIQIGGGRFVVVDRELEGPGVGVLVGVERPVLHRDVHDVVVVAE